MEVRAGGVATSVAETEPRAGLEEAATAVVVAGKGGRGAEVRGAVELDRGLVLCKSAAADPFTSVCCRAGAGVSTCPFSPPPPALHAGGRVLLERDDGGSWGGFRLKGTSGAATGLAVLVAVVVGVPVFP